MTKKNRTILAVGAYERDNFGDYLFYEVLRRYCPDDCIIPGSVIYGDMIDSYGMVVLPYDYVLRHYPVDAVWVVGGEVGGVDIKDAMIMSLDETKVPYQIVPRDQQVELEQLYGADNANCQAYIPDMSLYSEKNDKVPLIVNSVGLTRLFSRYQKEAPSVLSQASQIVVRDKVSQQAVKDIGYEAKLEPDIVHSLPALYTPNHHDGVGIIVQANVRYIEQIGMGKLENALCSVAHHLKQPITFLAAGTAYSHDSLDLYREMSDHLAHRQVKSRVITTRRPLELVDYIASARMTISTSLHVRIISASYGIPRISLENDKVKQYAVQWDAVWPTHITLDKLTEAVEATKNIDDRYLQRSDLTKRAHKTLRSLMSHIPGDTRALQVDLSQIYHGWQRQNFDHMLSLIVGYQRECREVAAYRESIQMKLQELDVEKDAARYYKNQLDQILESRSWRLLRRIKNLTAFLKRR